jgi:hypothetical protein
MKYSALPVLVVLVLVLVPAAVIAQFVHGYVYDATDSTGVNSARVEGSCTDDQGYFSTYTDTSGYYYVAEDTLLPAGMWVVIASHPLYFAQKKEVYLPRERYLNFYLAPRDTTKE